MTLKRIEPQSIPSSKLKHGPMCPQCGTLTIESIVPCPDPPTEIAPGVYVRCLVQHFGWRCESCGACYQETE